MIGLVWTPGMSLEAVEKEVILQALKYFKGNKTATYNALGIAPKTLDSKLEKYNVSAKEMKEKQDDRTTRANEWLEKQRWGHTGKARSSQEVLQTPAEFRVESTIELPTQQPMSMQIGEKIQKVSSHHATADRDRKRS